MEGRSEEVVEKGDKLTDLSPSAITEVVKHKIAKNTTGTEDVRMGAVEAKRMQPGAETPGVVGSPVTAEAAVNGQADTAYRDRKSVEASV